MRDNILFGRPLDVCKYQDVVEACELKEDFEMLPASDMTEIGERVCLILLSCLCAGRQCSELFVGPHQ